MKKFILILMYCFTGLNSVGPATLQELIIQSITGPDVMHRLWNNELVPDHPEGINQMEAIRRIPLHLQTAIAIGMGIFFSLPQIQNVDTISIKPDYFVVRHRDDTATVCIRQPNGTLQQLLIQNVKWIID